MCVATAKVRPSLEAEMMSSPANHVPVERSPQHRLALTPLDENLDEPDIYALDKRKAAHSATKVEIAGALSKVGCSPEMVCMWVVHGDGWLQPRRRRQLGREPGSAWRLQS